MPYAPVVQRPMLNMTTDDMLRAPHGHGRRLTGHCRLGAMDLDLLPVGSPGVCLDGTPAGFYM
eukprot:234539-Prymnesium_polylepis.2